MSSSRDGFVNNSRQIGPPLCEGADIPCKKWRSPSLSFLYYNFVLRMNNVNDRAPTALSPISGSKPFMWRTVGAKVKPFSESAKSIGSFFRADAQEKARRLILPPKKNPDALGETIPLSIGQESLLRSQKYAFFLYRQIFQNLFSTGSTKNSPRRKGLPPKKEDKRERIYDIVRARKSN